MDAGLAQLYPIASPLLRHHKQIILKKIRHCTPDSKPYQDVTDPQQFFNSWFIGEKIMRLILFA
jgi:hypothetical protein